MSKFALFHKQCDKVAFYSLKPLNWFDEIRFNDFVLLDGSTPNAGDVCVCGSCGGQVDMYNDVEYRPEEREFNPYLEMEEAAEWRENSRVQAVSGIFDQMGWEGFDEQHFRHWLNEAIQLIWIANKTDSQSIAAAYKVDLSNGKA